MARPRRRHDDCPYSAAVQTMKCISGRWKILIVMRLLENSESGFNELQRSIEGVSAKMLAQQLRELEVDGIVTREELVASAPKTVRYTLTPVGRELDAAVRSLTDWGRRWLHAREVGANALVQRNARERTNRPRTNSD